MTTMTIVDSLWRHNENCCYANMRSQGQVFVCWHLNSSVTCGTVVPRRWTCLSVIQPAVLHYILVQIMAWHRKCCLQNVGHFYSGFNVLIWIHVEESQGWLLYIQRIMQKRSQSSTQPNPDSKVHGANMGPIWGRQDLGGPHVGPMNFAIWEAMSLLHYSIDMLL